LSSADAAAIARHARSEAAAAISCASRSKSGRRSWREKLCSTKRDERKRRAASDPADAGGAVASVSEAMAQLAAAPAAAASEAAASEVEGPHAPAVASLLASLASPSHAVASVRDCGSVCSSFGGTGSANAAGSSNPDDSGTWCPHTHGSRRQ
jgi:hypothetical protein